MKMGAEIEVMWPQAKEHQGLLATTRSWKRGLGQILPQSLQGEPTLPTPDLRLLPPELGEDAFPLL